MRTFVAVLVAAVSLVVGAAPAAAGPIADAASAALRREPVFVHPDAERTISADERGRLTAKVNALTPPVFIAVLPAAAVDEVGGDAAALPAELGRATGLRGTYAVVAGNSFRAASNALPSGAAGDAATAAFREASGRGTAAVLTAFVDRIASARSADAGGPGGSGGGATGDGSPFGGSSRRESPGGGGGGGGGLPLLALLGLGGAGLWWASRRRRSQAAAVEESEVEADRELLRAELTVLADDVIRLESQVILNDEARAEYDAATLRYRTASAALDAADEPVDLVRVERLVREAQYGMDRTRARLEGREPPPPPQELQQPGRHGEPPIELDDRRMPQYAGYDGGGWYGGGGWFGGGGGGGLLGGLLLGSMLGGGFGGFGGSHVVIEDRRDEGGWGGDGGDFGGGDWGGGDSGGGDFGGGDAGGGDW